MLVIIQPVAHDELVADIHAFVVDGIVVFEVVGFEEEGGDAHVSGLQEKEFLPGVAQGMARIHDVFHDDHMAPVY